MLSKSNFQLIVDVSPGLVFLAASLFSLVKSKRRYDLSKAASKCKNSKRINHKFDSLYQNQISDSELFAHVVSPNRNLSVRRLDVNEFHYAKFDDFFAEVDKLEVGANVLKEIFLLMPASGFSQVNQMSDVFPVDEILRSFRIKRDIPVNKMGDEKYGEECYA